VSPEAWAGLWLSAKEFARADDLLLEHYDEHTVAHKNIHT
jgi:hypothetical protein